MRILILSQYYWPETFRINDLAASLKNRGHDITVYTGLPNYPGGKFYEGYSFRGPYKEYRDGIAIHRTPIIPRGNSSNIRLALNYASFATFLSLKVPFIDFHAYDIIFVFQMSPVTVGIPAVFIKKLYRIPLLFWVQDLWPESLSATGSVTSPTLLKLTNNLVRWIYHHCDLILVQSHGFISKIRANVAKNDWEKIVTFHNWAEDLYKPVEVSKDDPKRAYFRSKFSILFAGNIGTAQSMETILGAAELLRDHSDIHWIILGDGSQKAWVSEQVLQRGLSSNVSLLNKEPIEQMPIYFSLADALLITLKKSPIFELTIPSKLQSYLACGRPIVAALDGEAAHIIHESNSGLVVPSEGTQELADAVLHLSHLPKSQRDEMSQNAQQYYLRYFNKEKLIDKLEEVMLEMITK